MILFFSPLTHSHLSFYLYTYLFSFLWTIGPLFVGVVVIVLYYIGLWLFYPGPKGGPRVVQWSNIK